ncbi:MAG: hypothetical protein MUF73_02825 [Rhodobacteraceae bacterium]|jgi:hypothetical protein|nr:hypothetical protein [Paracoccaceae bacterium]
MQRPDDPIAAPAPRPSAEDARQLVALRVEEDEHGVLLYAFRDAQAAADMVAFLRDVMPRARFTVEPAYH